MVVENCAITLFWPDEKKNLQKTILTHTYTFETYQEIVSCFYSTMFVCFFPPKTYVTLISCHFDCCSSSSRTLSLSLSQKNTNKTISISVVRNSFPWQSNQTSHKQKEKRQRKNIYFSTCSCTHLELGVFYSFCNDQGLLQQAEDVSHIGNLRQIATTNWTSKWNEFTSVYATFCWQSHKNSNRTYSTIFFLLLDYRPIFANAAHIHTGNNNRCECAKMFICWNFSMLFQWLATDHTGKWWLRVGISLETHFES